MVDKLKPIVLLICLGFLVGTWPSSGQFPVPAIPGQFYWSSSGNDANDCKTQFTACQTIAHFNAFSFPASPAPVVHFNGGNTFTGGLTNFIAGMTITSYGSGQPTFSTGNSTACAVIPNIAGVTINNVICQGGGNLTNTTRGILFTNSTHSQITGATVTNSTVTGYGADCVGILSITSTATFAGFTNANVSNNVLHDCTGNHSTTNGGVTACLQIYFDQDLSGVGSLPPSAVFFNTTVSGNTVYNCTGTAAASNNWTGGGILAGIQSNSSITHNLVHDTGSLQNHPSSGPVGIVNFQSNTVLLAFNEVYHARGGPVNADGECVDISNADNVTAEYNYLHDCQFADILLGTFSQENNNAIIRFNVTEQGSQSELSIHSSCGSLGCTGWQIYNNTFVGGGIQTGPNSPGNPFSINLSNNIFIATNGSSSIAVATDISGANGGTIVLTGNDYSNSTISVHVGGTLYTTLATLQAACSSPNTVLEKTGGCVTAVGTTANPNLTGTVGSGGNCAAVFTTPCPNAYTLSSSTPAGQGNGLNLNSLYSFNVGTQDIYGNAVTNTTLPIGAAANK